MKTTTRNRINSGAISLENDYILKVCYFSGFQLFECTVQEAEKNSILFCMLNVVLKCEIIPIEQFQ